MLLFLLLALPLPSFAHPMDFGSMQIRVLENRLAVSLRLHVLEVARLVPAKAVDADALFQATLGRSAPVLGGDTCHWRRPALAFSDDKQYVDLSTVAVCLQAHMPPFSLQFPLPFLSEARPVFQLVARLERAGAEPITLLAQRSKPYLEVGATDVRSFGGFLRLGMGHIGALPDEWRSLNGTFHLPEGLDHIFFVLALVVGGGSLWGLVKCVSGFTLGHSLTLGLSTLKIIHVHSRWVEALIALSIAYVAGAALVRPRAPHRWVVAALFGTVHGLGFASALSELELSRQELLPALLGFNLGVEAGQCVIIALAFLPLFLLQRSYPRAHRIANRSLALGLFLVGSYWFVVRAVN